MHDNSICLPLKVHQLLCIALHAGTAGVLTLFGVLPPVMAWQMRYSGGTSSAQKVELVPGGRVPLLLVGCAAATVILNATLHLVQGIE
jgi:ferric-dicitrate binding protein FerR (iron transport regulator)